MLLSTALMASNIGRSLSFILAAALHAAATIPAGAQTPSALPMPPAARTSGTKVEAAKAVPSPSPSPTPPAVTKAVQSSTPPAATPAAQPSAAKAKAVAAQPSAPKAKPVAARPKPARPLVSSSPKARQAPAERPQPADGTAPHLSQSFDSLLRLLFRVVACAGEEPVPVRFEAVVARHCAAFQPVMERYRKEYIPKAQPFIVALQPEGLPSTVVYPFGGGDLLSALTVYPSLREVTTMSLEHVGDPRVIETISPQGLERALAAVRRRVSGLLIWTESTSENMIQLEAGRLPGQLAFFLVGLAVHGQEPVGLRFFDLTPEGGVDGISPADVDSRKARIASKLNPVWKAPSFSDAFSNSEITFRPAGQPDAPLRIHRHIAADLSNDGLKRDTAVLKHLVAKGYVAAMTKAASYLLWSTNFATIRNYLLENMDFMVSDSTGIPPRFAREAGFEVVP